jgi:quercetin dioxygenase-like cupin family protein
MHVIEIVNRSTSRVLDVLGPTVELLTLPEEEDAAYCAIIGTIPPNVCVPLHSHADPESFFQLSGSIQILSYRGGDSTWLDVRRGEFVHVPGHTKHAFRNVSGEPSVQLIMTTPKLGLFFREIGRPVTAKEPQRPPTPRELEHFAGVAADYGYWLATPAENAAVGIVLPRLTNLRGSAGAGSPNDAPRARS